jgi:hypothetical protein
VAGLNYRLEVDRVVETAERLGHRIKERFPTSGLCRVGAQLIEITRERKSQLDRLSRPIWPVRIVAGAVSVLLIVVGITAIVVAVGISPEVGNRADVIQAILALVDEVVLIGVAILFLMAWEGRIKRTDALRALYELRSLAHIIDMHQLTKDPENIVHAQAGTTSSPERRMTRFELGRYLDYCSELLSITSKLAALRVQDLRDPVVLGAVRDVESLAGNLQNKIWQKKQILELANRSG